MGECRKPAPDATIAPSVAPTSGIRSAIATSSAMTAANGTPTNASTTYVPRPQITLISRFPLR